jgi:hypothetical protein
MIPLQTPPEESESEMHTRLNRSAKWLDYPPTPDIATTVRDQLKQQSRTMPIWIGRIAAGIVLVVLIGLSVPPLRAAVWEWIQIGAVRIFNTEVMQPTFESLYQIPASDTTVTAFQRYGYTVPLEQAQAIMNIPLPMFPPDIGLPDVIIRAESSRSAFILLWTNPDDGDQVQLSLHLVDQGMAVNNGYPGIPVEVSVHDAVAVWLTEDHFIFFPFRENFIERTVTDPVLVWQQGSLTIRLEGQFTQSEALQIAESIPVTGTNPITVPKVLD